MKEKGGKPDLKPYPFPDGLRNPYRNLKSENSQDYAQKPQQNCTFMNSASGPSHEALFPMLSKKNTREIIHIMHCRQGTQTHNPSARLLARPNVCQ